jgi:hypothetical protein
MLITAAEVRLIENIGQNVPDARIGNRIQQMQDLDIKPFMGLAFYSDMLLNLSEQKYIDLINGVEYYTDNKGNRIIFSGLKPAMIYFATARYLNADKIQYTATGPKVKAIEESNNLSNGDKSNRVSELLSMGNAYINDVVYYLWNKRDEFPKWFYNPKNRSLRQATARITAIDKGNYNGFNAPQYWNGLPWDII